jgi:hypothetical protein
MAEERNLWLQLKRNTPDVVWTRIESTTALGIPDLHGFYRRCFWLELKIIKNNKINFSAHQIAWINRHITLGAPVFVLARAPRAKTIELFSGSIVRSPHTVDRVPPLISIPIRPKPLDWEQLLALLGSWMPGDSPLSIGKRGTNLLH